MSGGFNTSMLFKKISKGRETTNTNIEMLIKRLHEFI